ncbi:hypothetical protein BCE75_105220 [Isoptericola sp. CG 20/1183]|uniref:Uncharacterized protein n=1 Tax=Isoptericola halotolerans TaxID=300560 RepID=A0ABX5EDX5_9MICO|nr:MULTISPECIES: hypothetical protein [Isoptericola]PRZ06905.1 hypothetical protein BCL65_10543 [Isoptericola halotolerans]PRZ07423.1 hypothetical protein BCE75_105220 [Isoptericola sp. CG 20/1183]
MRKNTLWTAASAAALVVPTLAACSDSPEENTATACADWEAFRTALGDLRTTLTSEPTVGEVQTAREAVGDAYADLEDSLGSVADDRTEALDDAWESLQDAIDDVDDDASLADAASQVSEQADAVQTAGQDATAELGCS